MGQGKRETGLLSHLDSGVDLKGEDWGGVLTQLAVEAFGQTQAAVVHVLGAQVDHLLQEQLQSA